VPLPHDRLTRIHYNLAGFALEMGDHESAIEHAARSLSHAGPAGLFYEARMPRAIAALAQLQRGDADAAKWLLAELQSAIQEEMHFGSLAMSLTSHAARLGDAALLRDAAVATQEHLRLFSAPLQVNTALRPLIQAWLTAGWSLRDPGVRPRLEQALAIALSGRSAGVQALTEFSLARHQAAADPDLALWLYKRAANRLQSLRAGLPDGDPGLHRSWLSQHEGDLRDFVALLIERGRLPEAEQALRLLREEELFDYVRRRAPGGAGTALSFTATEVLRNEALAPVEQAAEQAAVAAAARVDARGVNALRGDYVDPLADADLERLTQSVHERLAAAPVANRGSLPRAETALRPPAGVARLSYLVREKGLDILVRTSAGHWRARVPLAPGELNRAIFAARAATSTAQRNALPALQHLWRILLAPVAFHLRGQRELRVQPDAALRYVPFAALHDGRRFLVEHYVLSTEAVAAPVGPMVARSELSIVAFGRTTGDAQHSALPGVAQELAALRQHGAEVHAEQAFSAKSLEAALRRHPDIVHVASHFRLDPGSDEASYLLLGDGSNLSVAQLAKLPWAGVRLALLSACDSATAPSQGREWLGLASALQRAGVSQVLATLWRVADESTAEWVQAFYALPQRGSGLLQARRLAEVQRDWLRRHRGDAQGHPHYWAAFTWLGGS